MVCGLTLQWIGGLDVDVAGLLRTSWYQWSNYGKNLVLKLLVRSSVQNYKLLLGFMRKFQCTGGSAKGTWAVAIHTIDSILCFVTSGGLGSSLSKHAFDMQDIVAPVSNNDFVWLLLTLTGKLAAYLLLLSLTSIISRSLDSYSESEAESKLISELSTSVSHIVLSLSVGIIWRLLVSEVISLTLSFWWCVLCLCLLVWSMLTVCCWWSLYLMWLGMCFIDFFEILCHLSSGFQIFSHLIWSVDGHWKL